MDAKHVIDLYDRYIAYTRHENELFHQRTTWFLALQTGLVALFSFTAKELQWPFAYLVFPANVPLTKVIGGSVLIFFIALFGRYTAVLARPSLQAAKDAQHKIEAEWKTRFQADADTIGLPHLMGGGDASAAEAGGQLALRIPRVLQWAWTCVLIAVGAFALLALVVPFFQPGTP